MMPASLVISLVVIAVPTICWLIYDLESTRRECRHQDRELEAQAADFEAQAGNVAALESQLLALRGEVGALTPDALRYRELVRRAATFNHVRHAAGARWVPTARTAHLN